MFGLLLLGVAVAMYGVWRIWAEAHGQDARPTGRWTSRTDAMAKYQREHPELFPPSTRRTWIIAGSVFFVEAIVFGLIVLWVINRPER